jgi:hypothetical protein
MAMNRFKKILLAAVGCPIIALACLGVTASARTSAAAVLVSEFRTSGPGGNQLDDEYVELYNNTDAPLDIGGYKLDFSDGFDLFEITFPSFVIPARDHALITNDDGYTLAPYAAGDFNVGDGTGIDFFTDNQGLELLDPLGNKVDAVGFNGNSSAFVEGTGLPQVSPRPAQQYSYARRIPVPSGGGAPQDTDNNAGDFLFVSTNGGTFGGVASMLGAPGPENSASPLVRNNVADSLIEPQQCVGCSPNRVRVGSGNSGTLSIRRRLTNNSATTLTALRFRVVDVTTLGNTSSARAPVADLRLTTSADANENTSLGALTVKGTTLQQPPAQAIGGGMNSSATVALPNGGLAPGATLDVQFLLSVVQSGNFRFFVSIEALPGPASVGSPDSGTPTSPPIAPVQLQRRCLTCDASGVTAVDEQPFTN